VKRAIQADYETAVFWRLLRLGFSWLTWSDVGSNPVWAGGWDMWPYNEHFCDSALFLLYIDSNDLFYRL